jgi:hypothetical protein
MKKIAVAWVLSVVGAAVVTSVVSIDTQAAEEAKVDKVLRHVVLFKFKDDATPEQIKAVEEAFAALPEKIDAIHDFEWGTNVSVEPYSQGFTHCFQVTFLSEEARAEYLPHPDHAAFGTVVGPVLDKVCVVDYWTPVD